VKEAAEAGLSFHMLASECLYYKMNQNNMKSQKKTKNIGPFLTRKLLTRDKRYTKVLANDKENDDHIFPIHW